jgi:hypothetical protein
VVVQRDVHGDGVGQLARVVPAVQRWAAEEIDPSWPASSARPARGWTSAAASASTETAWLVVGVWSISASAGDQDA